MNPREFSEYKEKEFLSPFACLSCDTKGRPEPAEKCQLRTEFQRDRDKILHSKSFRRLSIKHRFFSRREGTTTEQDLLTPLRFHRLLGLLPSHSD
jgi:dGTPase